MSVRPTISALAQRRVQAKFVHNMSHTQIGLMGVDFTMVISTTRQLLSCLKVVEDKFLGRLLALLLLIFFVTIGLLFIVTFLFFDKVDHLLFRIKGLHVALVVFFGHQQATSATHEMVALVVLDLLDAIDVGIALRAPMHTITYRWQRHFSLFRLHHLMPFVVFEACRAPKNSVTVWAFQAFLEWDVDTRRRFVATWTNC